MGTTEPFPSEHGSLPESEQTAFPDVTPIGDSSVDEVLHALTAIPELDEAAQHDVYERLHDGLLAELNTEHS